VACIPRTRWSPEGRRRSTAPPGGSRENAELSTERLQVTNGNATGMSSLDFHPSSECIGNAEEPYFDDLGSRPRSPTWARVCFVVSKF
jgi:hypothetical protein